MATARELEISQLTGRFRRWRWHPIAGAATTLTDRPVGPSRRWSRWSQPSITPRGFRDGRRRTAGLARPQRGGRGRGRV